MQIWENQRKITDLREGNLFEEQLQQLIDVNEEKVIMKAEELIGVCEVNREDSNVLRVLEGIAQVVGKFSDRIDKILLETVKRICVVCDLEVVIRRNCLDRKIEFLFVLSRIGFIGSLLEVGKMKYILEVCMGSEVNQQIIACQIINNIITFSTQSIDFLLQIGILDLLLSLLDTYSIPLLKLLLSSLLHLLPNTSQPLLPSSYLPSLLLHLPSHYLSLSPSLENFLLSSFSQIPSTTFPSFLQIDFYTKLQETLLLYSKHISQAMLSLIRLLLNPEIPESLISLFIDSGCYNALEYCAMCSPDAISEEIALILSSYFVQ